MDELLAKSDPPVTLSAHLQQVVAVGHAIATLLGSEPGLARRALLACALHDLGKATVDFQEYIRGKKKRSYPHALAGFPVALACEMAALGRPVLATATVLSHHSPLTVDLYRGYGGAAHGPAFHPLFRELVEEMLALLRALGFQGLLTPEECLRLSRESPPALLDSSLTGGSGAVTLRGNLRALPVAEFAEVKTVVQLADWLASRGSSDATPLVLQDGAERVARYIRERGYRPRPFQTRAGADDGPRLYLRAPTGTGKTEALLAWGARSNRLLYFLPTQATVNAMWRRLQAVFGRDEVGLAHGKASYVLRTATDDDDVMDERLMGSVFAKPVVVGTLDQYLLGALHGRHWEERLVLAQRSALVLDEIHSYEPYTLGLLAEALHLFPPERFAVASATLPELVPSLLGDGALIEAEDKLWRRRRHRLVPLDGTLDNAADRILYEARQGRKVLVVADTVQDAQAVFKQLQERWESVQLLHSRFTLRDRQQREQALAALEPGTVVVATQVIEVSLDLSFDVLFTEFAPLDALIQRMGRVNRLGDLPPAPVVVCLQWSRGAERVYGRELLEMSRYLFDGLSRQPTDGDLADACRRLYVEMGARQEYQEEIEEGRTTLRDVVETLGCYTISLDDEEMRSKFRPRRGMVSIEVLPEHLVEEAAQSRAAGQGWRVTELLVPVPMYLPKVHPQMFQASRDLGVLITSLPYDAQVGLKALAAPGEVSGGALLW